MGPGPQSWRLLHHCLHPQSCLASTSCVLRAGERAGGCAKLQWEGCWVCRRLQGLARLQGSASPHRQQTQRSTLPLCWTPSPKGPEQQQEQEQQQRERPNQRINASHGPAHAAHHLHSGTCTCGLLVASPAYMLHPSCAMAMTACHVDACVPSICAL